MDGAVSGALPYVRDASAHPRLRRPCSAGRRRAWGTRVSDPDAVPDTDGNRASTAASNRRYAFAAAAVALGMVGLTYGAVPFYGAFCRATGYEGAPQRAAVASGEQG